MAAVLGAQSSVSSYNIFINTITTYVKEFRILCAKPFCV